MRYNALSGIARVADKGIEGQDTARNEKRCGYEKLTDDTRRGTCGRLCVCVPYRDGSRFSTGVQVSNFIGFVPRLDYSGTIQRTGPITKRGNGYMRGLLVQAAWIAVRSKTGGALQWSFRCFDRLSNHKLNDPRKLIFKYY